MAGRKPLPARVKQLRGTDQPCRTSMDEMEYEKLTKVAVPKILNSTRARKIFKERAAELIAKGMLQKPDVDLLTAYANAYDMWMKATEQLNEDGLTVVMKTKTGSMTMAHPLISVSSTMLNHVKSIGLLFGFSPSARASLKMEPKKQEDVFMNFLNS